MGITVYLLFPSLVNSGAATEEEEKAVLRSYLLLIIFLCLFMAFVVAAGVEESMKHFVVRCCQFPSALQDPHTVLVYLLAAALGFATAENIEYVFGQGSGVPGVTLLEGELLILLVRILTPIHAICAVLQSVNYSKVLMGQQQMNLFLVRLYVISDCSAYLFLPIPQVLLPALFLHGSFDFILFLLAALGYIYDMSVNTSEIISLMVALVITVGGFIWAYLAFKKVENGYRDGWRPMPDQSQVNEV
ncbi:unnamed protein product [Sphagnum jensenii]|uniref:Uncharacterized protein n=1 Tax=Sphagnum jensenii TaxID=128206 RepID=A0ABP0VEE6_9BRYO